MKIVEKPPFTWYHPDVQIEPTDETSKEWLWRGGKWVIHDSLDNSRALAKRLAPYIDSREIHGAKIWHGDPTALLVYTLDTNRKEVAVILDKVGAGPTRVWFYDNPFANVKTPLQAIRAIYLYFRTTGAGEGHYKPPGVS